MEDRSFLSILTCAHGEHVWAPSTSAQNCVHPSLGGVSLSDLIWTYVVTGAYCLVQGRVWRFHQRNKDRLDPLSSTLKMRVGEKNRTNTREFVVYTLRGVMEIPRYSHHPKAKALLDCIYHSQAPCCRAPIPCRFTPPGIQGRMGSLPRARSGAGWLSSEWSSFCRDHARASL